MIFMGIDPGLNKTGVGIVYADIGKVEYIAHRLIKTKASDPLPFRLGALISGVVELILEYKPDMGPTHPFRTEVSAIPSPREEVW